MKIFPGATAATADVGSQEVKAQGRRRTTLYFEAWWINHSRPLESSR